MIFATIPALALASAVGGGVLEDVADNADRIGGWALALLIVVAMVTGRLISRRSVTQEVAAMRAGYEAKDEAYAEVLAAKDERIHQLEAQVDRESKAREARDKQVQTLLDEVATSVRLWSDATATLVSERGGGEDVGPQA